MATGFVSYTHADDALKNQLLLHLAALQREGLIDVWHDGMLRPGAHLDPEVQAALAASDMILLLVSPGFIASNYCYEQEMLRAFDRQRAGSIRVVPIILRPCQWKGVPVGEGHALGEFVALPKDGKPVTSWTDADAAFDDAVGEVRQMLLANRRPSRSGLASSSPTTPPPAFVKPDGAASLLGLPAKPTDLDRDRFLRAGFTATAALFEGKLAELKASEARIDTDFERIDSRAFAASVYVDGKRVGQVSIYHGGDMFRNALCLSYDTATSSRNSMNDWLPIEETREGLAFSGRNAISRAKPQAVMDADGAASYFWENFLTQVRSRIG